MYYMLCTALGLIYIFVLKEEDNFFSKKIIIYLYRIETTKLHKFKSICGCTVKSTWLMI